MLLHRTYLCDGCAETFACDPEVGPPRELDVRGIRPAIASQFRAALALLEQDTLHLCSEACESRLVEALHDGLLDGLADHANELLRSVGLEAARKARAEDEADLEDWRTIHADEQPCERHQRQDMPTQPLGEAARLPSFYTPPVGPVQWCPMRVVVPAAPFTEWLGTWWSDRGEGGRCALPAGHEGHHRLTQPAGDDQQRTDA